MYNKAIRQKAEKCGVKLWQIAEALGIADTTFSRKLRRELPKAERAKILRIIDELKGGEAV